MKHETVFGIAMTRGSLALASSGWAAVPLLSERGDMPVAEEFEQAPQLHQYQKDGLPIERNYLLQPPLIPHQIEGYTVTPKFNKCMTAAGEPGGLTEPGVGKSCPDVMPFVDSRAAADYSPSRCPYPPGGCGAWPTREGRGSTAGGR